MIYRHSTFPNSPIIHRRPVTKKLQNAGADIHSTVYNSLRQEFVPPAMRFDCSQETASAVAYGRHR